MQKALNPRVLADISSGPVWDSNSWDPWAYDENPKDGVIQKIEAIHAVQDYFSRKITKMQAIQVVMV